MPFCAGCGLNIAEFDKQPAIGATPELPATGGARDSSITQPDVLERSPTSEQEGGSPSGAGLPIAGPTAGRGLLVPPIAIIALIVVIGVIALGLVTGPQLGGSPGSGGQTSPGVASGAPSALIVGLTILSPADGQVVASKDVIVLGTAPPGLTITQDISFGFDQHATVDGTGHWAIKVGLSDGDNKLTFRIGDDHSTQRTIRVIYTPQKTP
jgi:hypothetical protein